MSTDESKHPFPPFTLETAKQKVKAAQHMWNSQDPSKICLGYTPDSVWRNRDSFLQGREAIIQFLSAKWAREKQYKLRKELFAFTDNKIAVQFRYEYYNEAESQWYRCYGLEDWTFAPNGQMEKRQMSGNDVKIREEARWFADGTTEAEWDVVPISAAHW
ncbi:DUF1348-domain-containing protein [Dacryopinax primogenitus]|uniref:DUF1348-domain-containing protein n=1 Tax=Dacryopinax primogenitus (strain DJM 731) TaxID=1858805 RepID=M5G9D1_DACPD|nr:DUF1348-domain-containing protein [Dacryopinax primogenitus]EJU05394.1 DUF1348-domain-containing protein [Dacryopinax primogenitus]